MKDVVIVAAVRTAIGSIGGALKDVEPDRLAETTIRGALAAANVESSLVDEVILGQTKQSTDAPNIARVAALRAGIRVEVPAYTVHRQCASGMQSLLSGYLQIITGMSQVVVAGGTESMSRAPFYIRGARFGLGNGNVQLLDPNIESQHKAQPEDIYGTFNMIRTADWLADKYSISREEQDQFALESQQRAVAAIDSGRMTAETIPVEIKRKKEEPVIFDTDEYPKRSTSADKLARLKPVFEGGSVTAGNASGRNDGAAAVVMMAADRARELGLRPLARVMGGSAAGVDPRMMGIGPVHAVSKLLQNTGMSVKDFGLVEINEAFAAQTLACVRELNVDPSILNVNGGAIALGHPLGCSGTRIVVTLIHEMRKRKVSHGLATLCVGGGMGMTMAFENTEV